jgi:hypothetical protein
MEVHHRPRSFGRSKYGAGRFIKGFLDLLTVSFLTGYAERPLHFLGVCGLLALAVGLAGLSYLAGLWALGFRPIGNRPVLIYSVAALLLGAQMLSVGILAELIASRVGGGDGNGDSGYSIERRLE